MKTLYLHNLSKNFTTGAATTRLFNDLSMHFLQGKTYALKGISGSGKSTLLHLFAGLDEPTRGSVSVDNRQLSSYSDLERAREVVLVPQYPLLIKEFSVLENVIVGLLAQGVSYKEACEQGGWYLQQVGLWNTKDWAITPLSGGQRQRVVLARGLSVRPSFLLADEITGALDEKTGREIIDLLLQLQKDEGMGIIIATHDRAVAERMDLVFTIKDGILVADYESSILEGRYERVYAEGNHP